MPASSKPVIRLQRTTKAKRVHKRTTPGARPATIKLAIRLNEGVNDALRTLIRYRGDLSKMALEALAFVDLSRIALVRADDPMVADTTITLPRVLHEKLKLTTGDRNCSMNVLVNTALAHWLAGKDAVRLE